MDKAALLAAGIFCGSALTGAALSDPTWVFLLIPSAICAVVAISIEYHPPKD